MPSDDFWSVSMLLHWVLMRDEHAVERMLGQYSDILVGMPVFEIQILDQNRNIILRHDIDPTRANRPAKTWNDVIAEYELDPPVPPATENRELVNALIRSMELTKATQHIYSALQRGALEGHARRNGSGDVERIAPAEWTRLRFLGIDGHDLAVPTDVNGEPLGLLRPMADYLSGSVHPDEKPSVWVDPEFAAVQARKEWPAIRAGQEVREPEASDHALFWTGAPGRPTSMHLILSEFERRRSSNALEPSLDLAAKALHQWLKATYPKAAPASWTTIRDKIRQHYRRWKESQQRPSAE
jgi:hypothetical protein